MRVSGSWKHLVLLAVLFLPVMAMAEKAGTCGMCGKMITEASNTFVITLADGEEQTYGCAGCGLGKLAGLSESEVSKASAEDFLRREMIPAESAYYLRGSEIGFCCQPYWLAFATREEAEKFARGFGGEVLDYDAALQKAPEDHPHGHIH